MNADITRSPLSTAMGGIIACVRGRRLLKPVDISTDTDAVVPIARTVIKLPQTNADFTGTGRSPTISIITARGFKIDSVWIKFSLPAQIARDICDKFEYDSLPAINAIQQIEASIASAIQLETVPTHAIIQRFYHYYGDEQFKILARKHWGGFYDPITNERGPLQTLTGVSKTVLSTTDFSQNEVFPRLEMFLPIPCSVFFNKERFNFFLSLDTPLDVKIVFRDTSAFISRTANATPVPLGDQLDTYTEYLNPNEYQLFFNNLPYLNPDLKSEPYYLIDRYFESFVKSYLITNDFRIAIKPQITERLQMWVTSRDMDSQALFFGSTVAMSASNSLGAMVWASNTQLNPAYTINLNTGTFVGPNANVSGALSIVGWSNGGSQFDLVWNRTSSSSTTVTIKSTTPFGTFGNLYMDLSVYSTNLSTGGFNNVLQGGLLFLCSSITLDIRPFTQSLTDINSFEIVTLTHGPARKLARGFYTFNPDPNNTDVNRHAFYSVKDIVSSPLLSNSHMPAKRGFAFDFFASRPVPATHNANPLVAREFIRLVKNQHYFYDLDCKWPIEVDSLTFEKAGSNSDLLQKTELWMYRPWKTERPNRWAAPIDIDYSYRDHEKNISSHGYFDFRVLDIIQYVIKLEVIKIQYDGVDLTDTNKEWSSSELQFSSLQWCLRVFQAVQDTLRSLRELEPVNDLNVNILNNVLMSSGIAVNSGSGSGGMRAYRQDSTSRVNRVVDSVYTPSQNYRPVGSPYNPAYVSKRLRQNEYL